MSERDHYLICYDISNNQKRSQAYKHLQAYAVGRQKSAYLCWLTLSECQHLQNTLKNLIEEGDALLWVALSERYQPQYFGTAQPWEYQTFIIM